MLEEDNNRPLWLRLILRAIPAAAITFYLIKKIIEGMEAPSYGTAFIIAGGAAMIGIVWAIAIGLPLLVRLGEKFGQLYTPSDKHFRVRPQFSIAESHAKAGRYADAIEQFRKDALRYPDELTPHARIAELLLETSRNMNAAAAELRAALPKARSAEAFAMLNNRLADLALENPEHGCDVAKVFLDDIRRRYPDTKYAHAAAERIARLEKTVLKNIVSVQP
jgi:hypothetical protein